MNGATNNFSEHPYRRDMVREMHLRRFAPVAPPARLIQMVLLVQDEQRQDEQKHLNAAPDIVSPKAPADAKHALLGNDRGAYFIWERHTEATTISAIVHGENDDDLQALKAWMQRWPGAVVRATQIWVTDSEEAAEALLPQMDYDPAEIVTCRLTGGHRIWSDFAIHDGYGRLVFAAGKCAADPLGRAIQRVQELGNYRNMSLLGFSVVQRRGKDLDRLEKRLGTCAQGLADEDGPDDETLLQEITDLSAELGLIRVECGFRLSATRAYANIVQDRLDSLGIEPIPGHQSLADFTERRLVPAVRTCESFGKRLDELAERTDGVLGLLNTRIDTRIKAQNRDLLASMHRSSTLQARLQGLVEGLSVIAASYYAVGLLGFLIEGTGGIGGLEVDTILAIAVIPIIIGIYGLVHYLKNRILRQNGKSGNEFESETSGT